MNILKTQSAKDLKKAFSCGLDFTGHKEDDMWKMDIVEGDPLWLGDKVQFANYLSD